MEVFNIKTDLLINEDIKVKEVRVISNNGEQMGVIPRDRALDLAAEQDMDLVLIVPNAQPPVCKIMDYGKYRFNRDKNDREARKNQRTIEIKEVRLSATIEEHDIATKANHAQKFLTQGNKIKVSIRFRGRQMAHSEQGLDVMNDFAQRVEQYGIVEKKPIMEGRFMTMIMGPRATK